MKRTAVWIAAALWAGAAWAEPPDAKAADRPGNLMSSLGEQHFARYCASCHGLEGRGDGPAATALSRPPADLTRIAERRAGVFPSGEIAATIDGRFELPAHGSRDMPIWGRRLAEPIAEDAQGEEVARGRIELLVEYLESIQVPVAEKQP